MEFKHISVLFGESIDALNIKPNGIYADGTLGGGGHSHGILSTNDSCRLIGIDQDKEAIAAAKERLKEFDGRVTFVNRNFSEIKDILSELDIDEIDGAVLDLGVSSYQLDNAERGFSYMHNAALDIDHRHVAGFHRKRIGIQALVKIAATALVLNGHAALGIVARATSKAQRPTSSRSANQAQACRAHKAAAGKPFSPFCQCSSLDQLGIARLHSATTPLPSHAKRAPTALTNSQYKAVHSTALRQDVS